jgi:hypothetical protein
MNRYDIKGEVIEKDDQSVVLAERDGDVCRIRIGSHNRLFRPLVDEVHELTVINKRTGQVIFPMHRCSIKCLENYVEFLKTGSVTFLHAAEREI